MTELRLGISTGSPPRSGPKVGFFGPVKTLDSARYAVEQLPDGRLRAWIEHDRMKGVTPEMLRWWLEHIDSSARFNGHDFSGPPVPVYRLWHPYDHVAVTWLASALSTTPTGRSTEGAPPTPRWSSAPRFRSWGGRSTG